MTALGLATGKLGNVRTQTLRAFSAADMKNILGKMSAKKKPRSGGRG